MFRQRLHEDGIAEDRRRPAGEDDTAAADSTGTIARRLVANLALMAQAYAQTAARDLRLAVRDIVFAGVVLGTVMMLGFYLITLLVAAAVLALALVLPAWAAALIVFAGVAVVTGLLLAMAALRVRRIAVRIRTTVQAAKEDVRWFRTRILRID